MVVAGGDYVHFVVEYGGKIEKCRVTETALLNRERMSRKDAGYAQLIAIFVRHRAEIEHLALAKLQREGHSDRGVVVTTAAIYAKHKLRHEYNLLTVAKLFLGGGSLATSSASSLKSFSCRASAFAAAASDAATRLR